MRTLGFVGKFATVAVAMGVAVGAETARAETKTWRGTTSSANVATNWNPEGVPQNGDNIVLDGDESGQHAMTWDINDVTPGSWTQNGYTNTVTFMTGTPGVKYWNTTPEVYGVEQTDGTREFQVSGDIIVNSGIWTVPMHPNLASDKMWLVTPSTAWTQGTGTYRLTVKAGKEITIGQDAIVNLNHRGLYGRGPGGDGGGAASHGGTASYSAGYSTRRCYGSVYRPKALGSPGTITESGGGAVWLQSTGKMTVNGKISADAFGWRAPSAGSVLLVGDSIGGFGTISASATTGTGSGNHPSGGGRVALVQTGATDFKKWTGTAEAMGYSGTGSGGMSGTVYFETADKPFAGDLLIRGKGSAYYDEAKALTLNSSPYDRPHDAKWREQSAMLTGILADGQDYKFDTITIDGYGCLGVGTNCTLRFNKLNCVGQGVNSLALYGGTLILPEATELTNMSLRSVYAGSTIKFADDVKDKTLTIGAKCTFVVDVLTHIEGNLVVKDGGYVRHAYILVPSYDYRVYLDVSNDLTVAEGSTIGGYGDGYYAYNNASHSVPGFPSVAYRGGSHGGLNQDSGTARCYGSIRKPVTPGASGDSGLDTSGGVITLNVGGNLKVDGAVMASVASSIWDCRGAGGSVWVTAKTLSGKGTISANGGYYSNNNSNGYGSGGGGRVAIWLTGKDANFDEFPLERITAYAGATAYKGADAKQSVAAGGTVYLKEGNEAENEGTLYLANRGTIHEPEVAAAQINSLVTDTDVGRVVVTNFGSLLIKPGCSLTVSRDFVTANNGRFKAQLSDDSTIAHGTVNFTDATRESRILGTNCFANLTCEAPGKTLRFGTADELSYTSISGIFKLTGAEEGESVFAKSTQDGTKWLLDITGSADVSYTTAWDSDARLGKSVVNVGGVIKDTENWSVVKPIKPGATNSWLGASELFPTAWTEAANWSQGRAPVDTDVVVIPKDKTAYPVLSAVTAYNSLVIEAGATLDLNACSISVTNALIVAGTLKYSGGETITFSGKSIDFTGGALSGPSGKLNLTVVGELAQEINLYNLAWDQIVVDKTANSIAWQAGFTADKFKAIATVDLPMSFKAGDTVTMRELELDGSGAGESKFITLASDTSASAWKLKVTQFASVIGVQVSDSDASPSSVKIYDDQPAKDNGGNSNWVFTRSRTTWVGTSGGSFTNDAMWSTGKAPDKDMMAIITANATIKVEGAALVGELRVLGTNNWFKGSDTLHIAETLYMDGGVLTLDVPMVVTNAAFLVNGSTITCSQNGNTDTRELNMTIVGDLTIDATSKISATGKGCNREMGWPGSWEGDHCAHGGRPLPGWDKTGINAACYGSVMCPTNSGSSCKVYGIGGGRVRLNVGGLSTVNGVIDANSGNAWITAAGGSVWLTTGSLAGKGTISANGYVTTENSIGGGGRVAVYLTASSDFDAFTAAGGVISAYGSRKDSVGATPNSSCGTVYLQGANGEKRIIIDNGDGVNECRTDFPIPMSRGGDNPLRYRDAKIIIRNKGALNLVDNCVVGEIEIETANSAQPSFFLNDYELNIFSKVHRDGAGWATWRQNKGELGTGRIKWGAPGTLLLVR